MRDQDLDRLYASFRATGDLTALGELFDRTAPELLRLGRHLGGSVHAAEDLVQSTFVTAIERASDFDAEREVLPWLVGILARHAANARRKRARVLDADRVESRSERDLELDASAAAEERELTEKLDRAVDALEPTYRDVLRAFLIEGKRPLEIADELGVSSGAIRMRVHRGLDLLRRALPAGFAAGAAVSTASGRGLGAVRAQVIAVAEGAAISHVADPSATAIGATPTPVAPITPIATKSFLGGLVMSQRALLVALTLALLAVPLWFARDDVAREAPSIASPARPPNIDSATPSRPERGSSRELALPRLKVVGADAGDASSNDSGVELAGRVIDRSGAPVAGAKLALCVSSAQVLRPIEHDAIALTDDDGRIVFGARVPPLSEKDGDYYVLFALHADGLGWTRVPKAEAGGRALGIEIILDQGIRFEARVHDAAGAPVRDALVRCVPGQPPFSHYFPSLSKEHHAALHTSLARAWSATTDERGVARIPHLIGSVAKTTFLPECHYVIDVEIAGECVWREHRELARFGDAVVDIVVGRESDTRITGRVVDENGGPLEGATVIAKELGRSATTHADGTYSLSFRPDDPLTIELCASLEGYGDAPRTIDRTALEFRRDGHDLVLRRPLTIAGRIVDQDGRGVAGVLVRGLGPERRISDTPPDRASDEHGSFTLESTCAGAWELNVYPPRDLFLSNVGKRWPARGGDRDVEIVLERRTDAKTSLEVDVVDAITGEPVDVLRATILAAGRASLLTPSHARWSRGLVRFDEIDAGRYDVWVAVPGKPDGFATIDVEAGAPARGRIEIGDPGSIVGSVDCSRIVRPPDRSISDCTRIQPDDLVVRATLATSTGASPGEPEFLQGALSSASAKVHADGSFQLADLIPGPWSFELEAEGVRCEHALVTVAPGSTGSVSLVAGPASILEFVVTSALPSAWVVVQIARDSGRWGVPRSFALERHQHASPMRMTVDPGRVRWRAMFTSEPNATRPDSMWETQEGEVELAAGARVTVPLRVVRIMR